MKDIQAILLDFAEKAKGILGKSLQEIILYGSYARGDYTEYSDVDLMLLTTLSDREIEKIEGEVFDLAFDFQLAYGIDISVILKNEEQFNYWLGALPFYDNVKREGVVIHG